jgi:hypothetical protein
VLDGCCKVVHKDFIVIFLPGFNPWCVGWVL